MVEDIHNLKRMVRQELIQVLLPVLHVLLELLRILVVSVLDQVEQVVMVVNGVIQEDLLLDSVLVLLD